MGFKEDLAQVVKDPQLHRMALRRAGSRELAEDALHEAYWSVARVKDPDSIRDLRAFFRQSLIHEIGRQLVRAASVVLVEDIDETAELAQPDASSGGSPAPASVESQANLRLLACRMLGQLDGNSDRLTAKVPPRSEDPRRYRIAVVRATRTILRLLLQGPVSSADWNAVLRSESPEFCDEPGLTADTTHQRLSRARSDVRLVLQMLVSKDELAS